MKWDMEKRKCFKSIILASNSRIKVKKSSEKVMNTLWNIDKRLNFLIKKRSVDYWCLFLIVQTTTDIIDESGSMLVYEAKSTRSKAHKQITQPNTTCLQSLPSPPPLTVWRKMTQLFIMPNRVEDQAIKGNITWAYTFMDCLNGNPF